jgi:cytochrome b561
MTSTAPRIRDSYAPASKWLHWITAACVLGMIPAGLIMQRLPEGALQDSLYDLHRSFGVLVFCLAVLRVLARRLLGVPGPAAGLTPFERIASTAAHHTMLALILVMPLVGWAMMSAYGIAVPVFGLFALPKILPESEPTYQVLSNVHAALGYLLALVITLHVAGAVMHGFIKRDGVLQRMLPDFLGRRMPR